MLAIVCLLILITVPEEQCLTGCSDQSKGSGGLVLA